LPLPAIPRGVADIPRRSPLLPIDFSTVGTPLNSPRTLADVAAARRMASPVAFVAGAPVVRGGARRHAFGGAPLVSSSRPTTSVGGSPLPHRRATRPAARGAAPQMLFGLFGKKKPAASAGTVGGRPGINPYRMLGVGEDATYEEVEAAVARLSIKYGQDQKKLMQLAVSKDKIFEERLAQRMSGSFKGKVKVSPYERPVVKKPLFTIPEWARNSVALPTKKYLKRTSILMGVFVGLGFLTPTLASSCMAMAFISAAGFLFNRGLPEVVRDDFGNAGEVRPVQNKVVLKTILINLAMGGVFFGLGQLYLLYLPLPAWCLPDSFMNFMVVLGLWLSCLLFQVQDVDLA